MVNLHQTLTLSDSCEKDRAYYTIENQKKELLTRWRFAYFAEWNEECEQFRPDREIEVPSCWQLSDFDDNQYVNYYYPFPYLPPKILKKNPCGVYETDYRIGRKEGRYELCFTGVDSYEQLERMLEEKKLAASVIENIFSESLLKVVKQCTM